MASRWGWDPPDPKARHAHVLFPWPHTHSHTHIGPLFASTVSCILCVVDLLGLGGPLSRHEHGASATTCANTVVVHLPRPALSTAHAHTHARTYRRMDMCARDCFPPPCTHCASFPEAQACLRLSHPTALSGGHGPQVGPVRLQHRSPLSPAEHDGPRHLPPAQLSGAVRGRPEVQHQPAGVHCRVARRLGGRKPTGLGVPHCQGTAVQDC